MSAERARDRFSPYFIGVGAVLSVAFMAHHPSVGSADITNAVAEMSREAAISAWAHGGLIVVIAVMLLGFIGLSDFLGFRFLRVRAATLVYGLGVILMMGAALVSGFIVTGLASAYVGEPDSVLQSLQPALRLCYQVNQTLAKAGTVALSAAILLWSWVLLGESRGARAVGVLGILVGAVPALMLFMGHLRLNVHGMGAVVLGEAVWSVAVAVWLFRQPAR